MRYSRFDDIDEWEEEDKAAQIKHAKKAKNSSRTRRRIDEYHEQKQLASYLTDYSSFS